MARKDDKADSTWAQKVVFDMDGTIANVDHRLHHITNGKKDWDAFSAGCVDDTPNGNITALLSGMRTLGYRIVIATGRFEAYRPQTEKWLKDNLIWPHDLFMRPDGDYRLDYEVKEDMLRDLQIGRDNILFVVDDRASVVEMWRRNGLTVLQCAKGDF